MLQQLPAKINVMNSRNTLKCQTVGYISQHLLTMLISWCLFLGAESDANVLSLPGLRLFTFLRRSLNKVSWMSLWFLDISPLSLSSVLHSRAITLHQCLCHGMTLVFTQEKGKVSPQHWLFEALGIWARENGKKKKIKRRMKTLEK